MRILLFSYWSIHEGISKGTLFPLIEQMSRNIKITEIFLCTVETDGNTEEPILDGKAFHVPFISKGKTSAHKFMELFRIPFFINRIVRKLKIDFVWCKGAPAGGVGFLVYLLGGTPFVVDSFEPHSLYMLDSHTWSKIDPKYLIQHSLETFIKKYARALLPVSRQFHQVLLQHRVTTDDLFLLPCVVNVRQFSFCREARRKSRELLQIKDDCIVGVYVGKYGGLYYDDQAFHLYASLYKYFGTDFFLILLTESDPATVLSKLASNNVPHEKVFIGRVDHSSVADYLSAADFGISTIKSVPAMRFCSPIKHGEYWASGLPILTTLSIGDDADIIRREGGGVIFDVSESNWNEVIGDRLKACIRERCSSSYAKLAAEYRHPRIMDDAIEFVLKKMVTIKESGY